MSFNTRPGGYGKRRPRPLIPTSSRRLDSSSSATSSSSENTYGPTESNCGGSRGFHYSRHTGRHFSTRQSTRCSYKETADKSYPPQQIEITEEFAKQLEEQQKYDGGCYTDDEEEKQIEAEPKEETAELKQEIDVEQDETETEVEEEETIELEEKKASTEWMDVEETLTVAPEEEKTESNKWERFFGRDGEWITLQTQANIEMGQTVHEQNEQLRLATGIASGAFVHQSYDDVRDFYLNQITKALNIPSEDARPDNTSSETLRSELFHEHISRREEGEFPHSTHHPRDLMKPLIEHYRKVTAEDFSGDARPDKEFLETNRPQPLHVLFSNATRRGARPLSNSFYRTSNDTNGYINKGGSSSIADSSQFSIEGRPSSNYRPRGNKTRCTNKYTKNWNNNWNSRDEFGSLSTAPLQGETFEKKRESSAMGSANAITGSSQYSAETRPSMRCGSRGNNQRPTNTYYKPNCNPRDGVNSSSSAAILGETVEERRESSVMSSSGIPATTGAHSKMQRRPPSPKRRLLKQMKSEENNNLSRGEYSSTASRRFEQGGSAAIFGGTVEERRESSVMSSSGFPAPTGANPKMQKRPPSLKRRLLKQMKSEENNNLSHGKYSSTASPVVRSLEAENYTTATSNTNNNGFGIHRQNTVDELQKPTTKPNRRPPPPRGFRGGNKGRRSSAPRPSTSSGGFRGRKRAFGEGMPINYVSTLLKCERLRKYVHQKSPVLYEEIVEFVVEEVGKKLNIK